MTNKRRQDVVPVAASFTFDSACKTLDQQERLIEGVDGKVGVLLAAEGVLAGLLAAGSFHAAPTMLGLTASFTLIASAALALAAFWPRQFARVPDAPTLARMAARNPGTSESGLKWAFIRNAVEAVEYNRSPLARKIRLLKGAMAGLLASLSSITVAFVWELLRG